MSSERIATLQADLAEWERLKSTTQRPSILEAIEDKITVLRRALEGLAPQKQDHPAVAPAASAAPANGSCTTATFSAIENFAWDQKTDQIKLYITLPNVDTLPPDSVSVTYRKTAFDLRVNLPHGGPTKRLTIASLFKEIDPSKCAHKVKKNTITLTLHKADLSWWTDLRATEKPAPNLKTPDDVTQGDPGASLMNLMKNLYEEGDDDMKRTIAKAWTESQEKMGAPAGLGSPF